MATLSSQQKKEKESKDSLVVSPPSYTITPAKEVQEPMIFESNKITRKNDQTPIEINLR